MTVGIDGASTAAREDETSASAARDDKDRRAEGAAQTQASTDDTPSQRRAETLTREEYADARRADSSPMSQDNSPDNREAPEGGTADQPDRHAGQPADHDRAEPRDRETYADDIRAGHSAGEHQGPAATPADLPARTTLDSSPASNGHRADQATEDHAATWQQAAKAPARSDADSAGASRRTGGSELVSSGEGPAGDQPGGRIFDADQGVTSAQDQRAAGLQPETITFGNKDIEVTHDAADGLWVEGLPGEPPTRIGDILSSPEESGRSRIESLREELTKDADDLEAYS